MSPPHLSLLSDLLNQAAAPGAGLAEHPLGRREITVTKLSSPPPSPEVLWNILCTEGRTVRKEVLTLKHKDPPLYKPFKKP